MIETIALLVCVFALSASLHAQSAAVTTAEDPCARFANYTPRPDARPTDADRAAVAANALDPLFWVEQGGLPEEYVATRRYCLVTSDCDLDLAMIFANGWGVARDYDAAAFFLCRTTDIAPAERDGMLAHIEEMRSAATPEDLLYCDHLTSGMGGRRCAAIEDNARSDVRHERVTTLKEAIPGDAAAPLDRLVAALSAFADEEAAVRLIDSRHGTAFLAFRIDEASGISDDLLAEVERLSRTRATACAPADVKDADATLNVSYRRAMTTRWRWVDLWDADLARSWLRDAQRAWITYRDAWTAFYQARWTGQAAPEVLAREIVCELTSSRSADLDILRGEGHGLHFDFD